jgi:hypothetical protein
LQTPDAVEAPGSDPKDLVTALKQRLGQCKFCKITPHTKVPDEELASRGQADGFIINDVTYVKHDRLNAWFPETSDRTVLRQAGVFHTKRPDTPTIEKKIAGIKGKPRYYAIKTEALGHSCE